MDILEERLRLRMESLIISGGCYPLCPTYTDISSWSIGWFREYSRSNITRKLIQHQQPMYILYKNLDLLVPRIYSLYHRGIDMSIHYLIRVRHVQNIIRGLKEIMEMEEYGKLCFISED
ncbi:hypothetical protein RF11_12537 [Thelohanellus kitauei]|uniref:Uncharacterized protein n=1 Tax=Thelohanellus kitauei TaxID=669202 RepID=A0A0C2MI05_THEKT|nr:hypothetical protein RF11_12537 [Thelohanellus kitauei]